MMGEALRRETYHTEKTRQENFILKIWVNTIFACETWIIRKQPRILNQKTQSHQTHHSCRLAQRFQPVLISLVESLSTFPSGNRKRRRFLRDLEDRGGAAYFVRHNQKGFAIGAVLFLDE